MLKCNLICVGKLKENYWRQACAEYEKRLKPFCRFLIYELAESPLPDQPNASQIRTALQKEADRILNAAANSRMVALCVEGESFSSEVLAERIQAVALSGISELSFIIGSSYGLDDQIKQKASLRMSMSAMTFPHQLARVMLCEQIYRAFQISHNGKYHK